LQPHLIKPWKSFTFSIHLLRLISPHFFNDFHLKMKIILAREAFVSTLICSPRLFSSGPLNMLYELLWNCFVPIDYAMSFDLFFEICGHIVWGHVPPLILCLFSTSWLVLLENQSRAICPIRIGETTYCLIAHILTIQFKDILAEHFSPH
jgi:hypothetical protein